MECLTPAMIGSMRLKNRFIFPSMCNFYCDAEGFVTEQLKAYVRARAEGGAAEARTASRARPGRRSPRRAITTAGASWRPSAMRRTAG